MYRHDDSKRGQKPNILFIMADDIGWMQVQLYADGLGVGETPNIDRIGKEGARFVDYVAMQSCTRPALSGGTVEALGQGEESQAPAMERVTDAFS